MKNYGYYLNFLMENDFSILYKIDNDATNIFFKVIKVRLFTLKTIEYKNGTKTKGIFKDYIVTIEADKKDYTENICEVFEHFINNDFKEIKN
jgi:hypothetical protein